MNFPTCPLKKNFPRVGQKPVFLKSRITLYRTGYNKTGFSHSSDTSNISVAYIYVSQSLNSLGS